MILNMMEYGVSRSDDDDERGKLKVEQRTELKAEILTEMKKVDFFPRAIDFKACLPFDQAWSRTYKNEVP